MYFPDAADYDAEDSLSLPYHITSLHYLPYKQHHAMKRSSTIHHPYHGYQLLPLYVQGNSAPPPSPFWHIEEADDDFIRDREMEKQFTREVKKDLKSDAEVEYYNDWIMSNVG